MRNGTAPAEPDLMTAAEVAALFRVTRSTVSRWAQNGVLDAIRVAGTIRFRRADVEALLAGREEAS